MKYDVFLSYSRKDKELAELLINNLKANGLTAFWDFENLRPSRSYTYQLAEALVNSTYFLMILTEAYIRSDYAKKETVDAIEQAKKSGMKILPIVTETVNLSPEWYILIGDIQWFTGSFEDASNKVVSFLVEEKQERTKVEILNRAYDNWNYGDFYSAELDINALLGNPVYANDPEINILLAQILEDEWSYGIQEVDIEHLIKLYKKALLYCDRDKQKAIFEDAEQSIRRLEKKAAAEHAQITRPSEDASFALTILLARMETADKFEQYMGDSPSATELNCLLTDYMQMINFCSAFPADNPKLTDRAKQCRDKIIQIREHLKTNVSDRRETILEKAYRNYLGLSRPEYPMYDVFISCKNEDEKYARQVYDYLSLSGKRTFFSKENISALGNSEYHDAIMGALDVNFQQ